MKSDLPTGAENAIANLIVDFFGNPFGYFGAGATILAFVIYFTILITRFLTKWETREKDLTELSKKMPKIEVHLDSVREETKDLPTIRATLHSINTSLNSFRNSLDIFITSRPSSVAESKSPLSLNSNGEKLAKELDAEKIIDRNFQELRRSVDAEELNNAFDVQQVAMSVARNFFASQKDDDLIIKAKDIAYNKGLPSLDLYTIFGILLRDKILEERGLVPNDIDKNTSI